MKNESLQGLGNSTPSDNVLFLLLETLWRFLGEKFLDKRVWGCVAFSFPFRQGFKMDIQAFATREIEDGLKSSFFRDKNKIV